MTDDTANRSGSETRKRQHVLRIRVSDSELDSIASMADRAELTVPSYARQILLDTPPPRARRKPSVDTELVARTLAELGKIGSNLNQIAHQMNAGVPVGSNSIGSAIADVQAMRDACMKALGRKP